jgi:hypothetical protein
MDVCRYQWVGDEIKRYRLPRFNSIVECYMSHRVVCMVDPENKGWQVSPGNIGDFCDMLLISSFGTYPSPTYES